MKRTLLIILCLTVFSEAFCNQQDIESKFNGILNELESIITKSTTKNSIVEKNFTFVLKKIRNNQISVSYDSTLAYSFRGCASSNIIDSLDYNFSFGKFILDAYETFPYLVYGIIVHEFQHLYDFTNNRELIEISRQNPIEKTYFEIDALMIEAMFLKTFAENKPNLSPIEKYLIMDIENNLSGSSTLFEKVDINLLHKIDAIKNKKITFEEAKKEYIKIGEELLISTKFSDNAWDNYCNVITLKTYTFYSRQILHDLLFELSNISMTNEQLNLENYPDINEIVKKIQELSSQHNESFKVYNDTMAKFEKYILSKMNK